MLSLQPYTPAYLKSLTDLVNTHLGLLPVVWQAEPREVSACLWGSEWPHAEFWETVDNQLVTCAVENDQVIGATHLCRIRQPEGMSDMPGSGILNWLFFQPDRTDAAALLLKHAQNRMREIKCAHVVAFEQCSGLPFVNFTRGYSSSRWAHINTALANSGFSRIGQTVNSLMAADLTADLSPAQPDVELTLTWRSGAQSEVIATDKESGGQIGFCTTWDMAAGSSDPAAALWEFVAYVEVEPAFRKQGIGEYLLLLQMQRAAKAGKRHLGLVVQAQNKPAHTLYRKLGFKKLDEVWSYEAMLSA